MVIGGWALAGESQTWSKTVEILNLGSKHPAWVSVPQPFQRRALMAATLDGQVYVIGGIDDKQQIVRDVTIYDPKKNQWKEGPKLPDGALLGFAPAAGVHKGRLYVSIQDGKLLRLDSRQGKWEEAGSGTSRVAHRLASQGNSILVMGGASKGKNLDLIEAIPVN